MLSVTEAYKEQMRGERNAPHVRITYDFVNTRAQNGAVFNRSLSKNCIFLGNDPQLLTAGNKPVYTYVTAEKDRMPTGDNNNFRIIPYGDSPLYNEQDKVISETLSGEDGMFTIPPTIVFDFDSPQEFFGFSILFDYFGGGYATDFELHFIKNGSATEVTYVTDCNSSQYVLENIDKTDIVSIKIVINAWSHPHQRARMGTIDFGVQMEITNHQLSDKGVTHSRSIDLLSIELSRNEIDFNITNLEGDFNALNPTGLWRYVEPNQKVVLEYGREIDGVIEWLKADTLYLDGNATADSLGVSFYGRDKLSSLEHECYGAPISEHDKHHPRGISLSNLAKIIIDDYPETIPYKLDPCLDTIYTTARLDIMDIKEALQLIANAGHCILYTDHNGVVTFKNALDPIITVSDNGGLEPLSNTQRAFNDIRLPTQSYVVADKDYITTNGTMLIASDDFDQLQTTGFISKNVSNSNGIFAIKPTITISYSIPTSIYELPIVFDNVKNEYATSFSVTYQFNNQTVDTVNVTNNTQVRYSVLKNVERLDKIIITINSWSKPNQRSVVNQINGGRVNDFYLDFNNATQKPVVSSIDKIKQIDISFFVLQPGVETIEVEGYCSRVENGNAYYKITHEPVFQTVPSFDINVSVNGIYAMYPTCTEFSIRWTSPAEPPKVTLVGTKIDMVEHINSVVFNHHGITKTFRNPLITSREQSELIARWLYDYIEKTSTFNVPYRGNPEVEPFDVIYLQSQFEDYVVSRVKSNTINFNGGMSGEMEVIKL
jgi:hypothetical protein